MIEDLSARQRVAIVATVAGRYVRRLRMDPKTSCEWLTAIARSEDATLPDSLISAPDHPDEIGDNALAALNGMLQSPDPLLRSLAREEVDKSAVTAGQMIDPVTLSIAGGYLLGLAVLSKVSYDQQAGWAVQPGFPGLAKVLAKLGGLLKAVSAGA